MKVLLAEDSLTVRRLLAAQLERWNYEVVEAADGAEAWNAFQNGNFELVLTDWIMPEVDGLELIRRIRNSGRTEYVYIVLLTARSENENLVEAMEVGADDFLGKPWNPKELRVRLAAGERILDLEHTLIDQNHQLQAAQAALIQSEKLAGVGQLAAGMAHEINNPIAFVANNLAVLRRDVEGLMNVARGLSDSMPALKKADAVAVESLADQLQRCDLPWLDENLPQMFASSEDGLSRVRQIVENLRDFAHLDEAEWDNMNVSAAIDSTLQVLAAEFDARDLTVTKNYNDDLYVHCCPAKIKQVFHGILLNAVQACDSGQNIEVAAHSADESVCVKFTDHGVGIDEETQQHLFEPFFTTRAIGSGKGLGMAVSYGVVQQHGGTIEVESTVGQGTTITVVLPVTQAV